MDSKRDSARAPVKMREVEMKRFVFIRFLGSSFCYSIYKVEILLLFSLTPTDHLSSSQSPLPTMANSNHNPNNLISYGPSENCTLTPGPTYCPPTVGVYEYRPSLAANTVFIVFFFLGLVIHLALGIKYKTWAFLFAVFWGCVSELIGYGGRVMMWENPFSFTGFLIQICKEGPAAAAAVDAILVSF